MRLLRTFVFLVVPLTALIAGLHGHGIAAAGQSASTDTPSKSRSAGKFSLAALDRSVDPCTDFYQFTCGGWEKENPIPADRARWGRFDELHERNQEILKGILERAGASKASPGTIEQKIGDYYAACMDEPAIERRATAPIKPERERAAALADKTELAALVGQLHRTGADVFFEFGSEQDFKNSSEVIAIVGQSGMGLPDRDYYFKDDAKSVETRKQYVEHVAKMFGLVGEPADAAKAKAGVVMRIETELARHALDNVSRRDPNKIYHRLTTAELQKLSPGFDWKAYFSAVGAPAVRSLNVTEPEFVKGVEKVVATSSLDDLRTYLSWRVATANAALLSNAFVDENFDFYGRKLTGQEKQRDRWKRCVAYVDEDLGEALGQQYVRETFGEEGKRRMMDMVTRLETALTSDVKALPWMTDATKQQALKKLATFRKKIGYPEKWRDYSALEIGRDDLVANSMRANRFELARQLAKIGKPVDRDEWEMTPPEVNAYYHPLKNEIVFPAGILQPPFFDRTLDDAVNYGGIGAVIGHELTHGYDDQGRQFDAAGNLQDWWTPADAKAFEERAACFVTQYGGYTAIDDLKLNGKLTLGENVADNGGVRIALMALSDALEGKPRDKTDDFAPEQRFFLGWGQIWCQSARPEMQRMLAQTDPHSPGRYRVNGVVSNMPEFRKAFGCKAPAPMVRAESCRVW
jgi:putative endopeptidase